MSHDDHDHNPRMQPTNKEAHHAIVWLSSGLIVVGVIGLLAGQIVGVTGVITGALHRMCRRGLAADRAALTTAPCPAAGLTWLRGFNRQSLASLRRVSRSGQ